MKPVIGVMPLWDDNKKSQWMLPGYLEGIRIAGGLPVVFPMTTDRQEIVQLCDMCSGFLFTGGHDVGVNIYGEVAIPGMVESCSVRDEMENKILAIALSENKPILGICRGIQFINAALGGTLYQDLPTQHPTDTEHHMTAPYDREAHKVHIRRGTPLFDLLGEDTIGVNSYHHQAIKDLSPKLQVMAESEDGLIEAVYMPDRKYVWALQWHPEFSYKVDPKCRKIFAAFVNACK